MLFLLSMFAWSEPGLGVGARVGVWMGDEVAPQVGGYLALRPADRLHLSLFTDHSGLRVVDAWVVDHVIGFMATLPVVRRGGSSFGVGAGSCVDFRTWRRPRDLAVGQADVWFGPRLGGVFEHQVDPWWSVQVTVTGIGYVGNTGDMYGWREVGPGLSMQPVVEAQVGLTRWLAPRREQPRAIPEVNSEET